MHVWEVDATYIPGDHRVYTYNVLDLCCTLIERSASRSTLYYGNHYLANTWSLCQVKRHCK